MKVTYDTNNSGGDWWLSHQNWLDLEAAGWVVNWLEEPFLDATAASATREGLTLREAVSEWERVVGQDSEEIGCECCGPPHYFWEE